MILHSLRLRLTYFIFLFIFLAGMSVSMLLALAPQKANALSGSDFNAGRIIDDVVFTNKNAMSVADIQNFLNAKVPNCDVNGTQNSSHWNAGANRYYTRAEWGAIKGYPAPFTCLKMYYENPSTLFNNASDPSIGVPEGKSAAQIIWDAAQRYDINPQVLLVTLQKEQSLITDDWPWENQYNYATGWGCPDTAACNQNYKGFYRQVDKSAWQFRYYLDHPNAYNYWVGNYYVQYNPNTNCGGSVINIQNAATAALYIYTPYQPNAAALNNLNGSGDSCSAYGNRNFWRFFTDWFGSTHAANFSYQVLDQYVYTDETKTVGASVVGMLPGKRVYAGVKVKNTGNRTWTNSGPNPVHLATERPGDRSSNFCDPTWLGCNRPANMKENSVAPGETATFEFWMLANNNVGEYDEYLNLVSEGQAWFPFRGLYFATTIARPTYTWQPLDQYAYTDETKTVGKATTNLSPGDKVYVGIKARNTGNMPWNRTGTHATRLGTIRNLDRTSVYYDGTWLGTNRPAALKENTVQPGEIGTFEFWLTAKGNPGTYLEFFAPVAEGYSWMNDAGFNFHTSQITPSYSWKFMDQYAYTDETKTVGKGTTNLDPGDRVYVGFKAKNMGNVTWRKDGSFPVHVGMTHPLDRLSAYFDDGWLGQNRPAKMVEEQVAPGETATFEFWMKAPSNKSGVSLEYFSLVAEGAAWMNDPNMNFYMSTK